MNPGAELLVDDWGLTRGSGGLFRLCSVVLAGRADTPCGGVARRTAAGEPFGRDEADCEAAEPLADRRTAEAWGALSVSGGVAGFTLGSGVTEGLVEG
jgi:hypothetical protein